MMLSVMAAVASAASLAGAAAVDLSKLPPVAKQDGVTFDKDIKPLFESSCLRCHGAERPKGGIRLDSQESVLKGGKEGKIVTPGNSEKSVLVVAISQINPENAMPPKPKPGKHHDGPGGPGGTNGPAPQGPGPKPMGPPPKPLTPEQVGLVRAWIDQGAK
jgi:mono/diheme cytochrome c family protein